MKWLIGLLIVMLVAIQLRLWWGQGGLLEVWQLEQRIVEQEQINQTFQVRNDQLQAEVLDLKQGLSAIEERARSDLGLVKPEETFYQLVNE
jgi:cell division protein FtsB